MATVHYPIRRPSTSFLLILLLSTPALAQDERPPISIPQPERRLATPAPGGPLTIVQVSYKNAIKERDYLSLAVQELMSFTRISTQLEVPLPLAHPHPRRPAHRGRADALHDWLRLRHAHERARKERPRPLPAPRRPTLCRGYLAPRYEFTRGRWRNRHPPSTGSSRPCSKTRKFSANDGARWRKLPKSDPLYSAYFDFSDGPPLSGTSRGNVFALEAIELKGRIAVIFSDLNISWFWGSRDAEGRDRSLQFGTNLLVYALAQKYAGRPLPFRR